MENEDEIIKVKGLYGGYSAKGNYDVSLNFRFTEENLMKSMQFIAGIGKKLKVIVILGKDKIKLGNFNVYSIKVDHNANCTVTFKSNITECFVENFSKIISDEVEMEIAAKIIEE